MSPSDIAAWWGAAIGTAVFGWDIYKWRTAGPKIEVSASPNMLQFAGDGSPSTGPYLAVEARNNGDRKTTITHVVLFWYRSKHRKLLRKQADKSFIVPCQEPVPLPHVLEPGERWMTMTKQDGDMEGMGRTGALYAGVIHSGSKRPVLVRVVINPVKGAQQSLQANGPASGGSVA